MISISVQSNITQLTRDFTERQKQNVAFAASKTINDLAYQLARQDVPKMFDKKFKGGATPFTQRAMKYTKSSKRDLRAIVYVDQKQWDYLKYQLLGGVELPKRKVMILPSRSNASINKYGNLTKAAVNRYFGASYVRSNLRGRSGRVYKGIIKKGRGRRGADKLVALMIKKSRYNKLIDLPQFVTGVVNDRSSGFNAKFLTNFARAMETSR